MYGKRLLRLLCGCLAIAFAAVSAGGQTKKLPDGLHIPRSRQTGFNYNMTDGAGKQWYFQNYLNVYRGINYVYSGALYCQVNGSNVRSNNNMAWLNATGNEIEIGPYTRNNCQIYRRAKIYKDRGLARWLDIFVNTTSSKQTVPVRIYSSFNRNVSRTITSSGAGSFGKKDWAFITEHQGQACLLHVVCSKTSKVRPTVSRSGNSMYVNYSVTVPPGGVAILCYFEAQATGTTELKKQMSQFNASRLLSDLPSAVRRLIVNFRSGGIEQITLDRQGTADLVLLKDGDSISGTITNKEFIIEPFFGPLTLPAEKVIGFAAVAGQESAVHAVLVGRQVVTGKLKDAVIKLALPTGGNLDIPFSRIRQCSYRISKAKPDESSSTGPLILLRTGDRLAFDPANLKCTFQTRHGTIKLAGKDLLKISMNHGARGVHRAQFRNGSMLAGLLGPERFVLPIKLGPELDISRDMVLTVCFAEEDQPDTPSAHVLLNNEDELFGSLQDKVFEVATDFGAISVRPENILKMSFSAEDPGRVAIKMWDGSTLRGKIRKETLRFTIQPGPTLNLHVGHIVSIDRPSALPPDGTVKLVEKYVAMLSAASYKDRQEAQEALIRMGPTIAPLLKQHVKDPDPEVRQRITNILEKLGAKVSGTGGNPHPVRPNFIQPGIMIR